MCALLRSFDHGAIVEARRSAPAGWRPLRGARHGHTDTMGDSFGVDPSAFDEPQSTRPAADSVRRRVSVLALGRLPGATAGRMRVPLLVAMGATFGVSLTVMGAIIGASQAATGVLGPFVCRRLDRVPRRRALRTSLVSLIVGCLLISVAPSAWSLAVGFSAVALGNILYSATTIAWIADTVPLSVRSALVGRVELAWSAAFLIGVPLATAAADITSWQLAYALVGVAAIGSLVAGPRQLARDPGSGIGSPAHQPHEVAETANNDKLQLRTGSPLIATAGLLLLASQVVLIAYAAWLTERFGLPLGVIGALAIALGIGELAAAVATIAFSDRLGQLRSARYGLAIMCLSSAALAIFEDTLLPGIAALFVLLLGFEFALISTKPVIAELASSQRSYALGFAESSGIVGRAGGAVLGAILFERYGMPGPALATGLSGIAALGLIGLHQARSTAARNPA